MPSPAPSLPPPLPLLFPGSLSSLRGLQRRLKRLLARRTRWWQTRNGAAAGLCRWTRSSPVRPSACLLPLAKEARALSSSIQLHLGTFTCDNTGIFVLLFMIDDRNMYMYFAALLIMQAIEVNFCPVFLACTLAVTTDSHSQLLF